MTHTPDTPQTEGPRVWFAYRNQDSANGEPYTFHDDKLPCPPYIEHSFTVIEHSAYAKVCEERDLFKRKYQTVDALCRIQMRHEKDKCPACVQELAALTERNRQLEGELAAYKKAKAENDERFQLEAAEMRSLACDLARALSYFEGVPVYSKTCTNTPPANAPLTKARAAGCLE